MKKNGYLAYVLSHSPGASKMIHSSAGADPRAVIENALNQLAPESANAARKHLGAVLEGRGELDAHGLYLAQSQVKLADGKTLGVFSVAPCEVL